MPISDKHKLLFFTVANKKYYKFVPLYIFFALSYNPDSDIEIVVEDVEDFFSIHGPALDYIDNNFSSKIKIRGSDLFGKIKPHTIRFLEEPESTEYTHVYIGDVDILILEHDILGLHLSHMDKNNLSFSNIVRPKTVADKYPRLTGCHFAPKEIQYPIPSLSDLDIKNFNDERILHEILKRKGVFISVENKYRPIHGLHISPNRKVVDSTRPSWNVNNNKYMTELLSVSSSAQFKEYYHRLDVSSKSYLLILEYLALNRDDELNQFIVDHFSI
ncbi:MULTISPECIES: hypothetical protein [Cobetia]|uniref:hypothetical protein n=1 Tax=Cobetia TaxID=204286 RepID=UPI0015828630|nr:MULTISPECIES: hypothetical protein [Cobetia]MDI4661945.1 hypothetical protein [Cobetia sp. BMC6]NUJ57505.1 hypothetical protein [Cobetia marina]